MRPGYERVLARMEIGLYVAGASMLFVLFAVRFDLDLQREAGIRAFRQAMAMPAETPGQSPVFTPAESALDAPGLPDQSLWSEHRIRAHAHSMEVSDGAPLAVMTIDRLGVQVPVYDGADDLNLNRGVARIAGTARIDEPGNLGIAGHRDGFFRPLKDIAIGDQIKLTTPQRVVTYRVSAIDIVDPADVWVLHDSGSTTVTLVTCYPFYFVGSAPKRFIVKAEAQSFQPTILEGA